ncbi:hypothetical protein ACI8AC_24880 [Geodermatophilus sp. SYSU D00758]
MQRGIVVGGVAWALGSALAFLLLDPILAAFLAIIGLCLWVVAFLARDWDRHSSFEERELHRARRRAAQRERTRGARDRDRARWEAHQRRRSGRETG